GVVIARRSCPRARGIIVRCALHALVVRRTHRCSRRAVVRTARCALDARSAAGAHEPGWAIVRRACDAERAVTNRRRPATLGTPAAGGARGISHVVHPLPAHAGLADSVGTALRAVLAHAATAISVTHRGATAARLRLPRAVVTD